MSHSPHSISALVIDDDLTMRLLIRESLEPLGYRILEAEDGRQGVEIMRSEGADIILMDVQMPIMDGFEACRLIRAQAEHATIPILFITGLDDVDSIEKAYRAGATDFITKPIDWLILRNRVRYMVRAGLAADQVRRQEATLLEAQRIAQIGNWELDIANNTLQWSEQTYRIFGRVADNAPLTLRDFIDTIHPDDRDYVEQTYRQSLADRAPYRINHRLRLPDGRTRYVEEQCKTYYDRDGKPLRSIGTVQDISERMQAEKRIRTLSQALEQSPVSVMITDTQAHIEYVNRAYEESSGYRAEEVLGRHTRFMNIGDTPQKDYDSLWSTITSGQPWHGELHNRRKDGSAYWVRANISPVHDEHQRIRNYLFVGEDITLYKEQEEKILHQAHFDGLTQLPNRFLVLDRLTQSIKEAHRHGNRIAVLFLDLDDFKKINDSLGHHVGDRLLVDAAGRLTDAVREQDTVGRLGGDEFIIVLNDLERAEDAIPVAENILQAFRRIFRFDQREFLITISIGIALYPDDGDEPNELLRKADTAMYRSKEEGRNTLSFITEEMNRGIARRLELEEALRGAMAGNELAIQYQPLINAEQRINSAEALLRWHSPTLGLVSPAEFIPIAEQLGIIIPIGRHVLEEAIRFAAFIRRQNNPDFSVAVNVSPVQFRDTGLTEHIAETLQRHDLPPSALTLEITEGVVLNKNRSIAEILDRLHTLGVRIAMDDFGTGYSSFNYLRQFPFTILKIDRSYILGISGDQGDDKLVSSIISMAHGLGLEVVAEGVETEAQRDYLLQHHCDYIQGYLYSRPLPADGFQTLIKTWDSSADSHA